MVFYAQSTIAMISGRETERDRDRERQTDTDRERKRENIVLKPCHPGETKCEVTEAERADNLVCFNNQANSDPVKPEIERGRKYNNIQ